MDQPKLPDGFVPPYTDEEIQRRFRYLLTESQRYVDGQNRVHPTWRLRVDPMVVLNVSQSSMDDIWRYKSYHLKDPNRRSDAIKRAAFWTKWIVRLKPIYFARIPGDAPVEKNDTSIMMNEGFAIHIATQTVASELKVGEIVLDPEFYSNLLYDLHYRDISSDALLNTFDILRTTAAGSSIVMKVIA